MSFEDFMKLPKEARMAFFGLARMLASRNCSLPLILRTHVNSYVSRT